MSYRLIGHTDGASRGNPGPAGAGVVITDEGGREREAAALFLGRVTNNVAEYRALGEAVRLAAEVCRRDGVAPAQCHLVIYTDSQLMARQVSGEYQMKSPDLKPLLAAFRREAASFAEVRVVHVPREKNTRADELANRAIDQATGQANRAIDQAAKASAFSRLSHLECSRCGQAHPAGRGPAPGAVDPDSAAVAPPPGVCPACGAPLLARYRLDGLVWPPRPAATGSAAVSPASMWRYHELLPVESPGRVLSLGEGGTPLLPLDAGRLGLTDGPLGRARLWLKDEGRNPTGTFKARGAAACVSRLVELGWSRLAIPTAGNAGSAFAAYAARAGLPLTVAMPADTPAAIRAECAEYGAEVHPVDGLLPDAARYLRQRAGTDTFIASTFDEPWRVEGKKTIGFELFEGFGGRWPDAVLCPVGGGVALVAIWKAAEELAAAGVAGASPMPKLFAIQAEGCSPVVRAYAAGRDETEPCAGADTVAVGLRVPAPKAGFLVLRALRQTGGAAVAVSDREILDSADRMRRSAGLDLAPEGAAASAGLTRLAASGALEGCADIVVLNTGTGMKYR